MKVIQSNLLLQTGLPSRLGKAAQSFLPLKLKISRDGNSTALASVCKIRFPLYCEGTVTFLNSLIIPIITLNQYLSNIYIFMAINK